MRDHDREKRIDLISLFLMVALATASFAMAASISGCAGDPCQEAVAHVQSCLGGAEHGSYDADRALASCNPAQAEQVLGQSCDSLRSGAAKADGCVWWMPWTCWGGGGGDTSGGKGQLNIHLDQCAEIFGVTDCTATMGGMRCIEVTVEDASGAQVASGTTGTHGSLAVEDLPAGSYTVKVWQRGGTLATMVKPGMMQDTPAPAELAVEVEAYGKASARLYFAAAEVPQLVRCSSIAGTLTGRCNGDLDPEETEWTWFVEIEPLAGASGERRVVRPGRWWQEDLQASINRFHFSQLMPGSYRIVVHEMDIPSYLRSANPDYDRLLRWYVEHERVYETTITVPEAPGTYEAPSLDVTCR